MLQLLHPFKTGLHLLKSWGPPCSPYDFTPFTMMQTVLSPRKPVYSSNSLLWFPLSQGPKLLCFKFWNYYSFFFYYSNFIWQVEKIWIKLLQITMFYGHSRRLNMCSHKQYLRWNFFNVCVLWTQLCPTLCDPMGAAHQDPLFMGILQAGILEWVAMLSSRWSSQPRDQTQVSHIADGFFTLWTTTCSGPI